MTTKAFALTFLIQACCWAGGSVIGNGAGIVENNFQYAYQNLSNTLLECISQMKCEMSPAEIRTLKDIQGVLKINRSNERRILFVSEKEHPDFFNTGEGEVHRVAKTGLTPEFPIYVNVDLLYTEQGKPAFDYATISSILVHELGHQTGEQNHAKLDIIGSKIKKIALERAHAFAVQIGAEQVEISILNQAYPFQTSDLSISWEGYGAKVLTPPLMDSIFCNTPGATMAGFDIDNGHFTSIDDGSKGSAPQVGFGFWVHLSCYSKQTGIIFQETQDVQIAITRNLEFKVISVRGL